MRAARILRNAVPVLTLGMLSAGWDAPDPAARWIRMDVVGVTGDRDRREVFLTDADRAVLLPVPLADDASARDLEGAIDGRVLSARLATPETAVLAVQDHGRLDEIDAPAALGFAVAVRLHAPVLVDREVLTDAALVRNAGQTGEDSLGERLREAASQRLGTTPI